MNRPVSLTTALVAIFGTVFAIVIFATTFHSVIRVVKGMISSSRPPAFGIGFENSEGYSAGNISGQEGWTSSNANQSFITTQAPLDGLQSLRTANRGGENNQISDWYIFAPIMRNAVPFSFDFSILATSTTAGADIIFYSGTQEELSIGFINNSVKVLTRGCSAWVSLDSNYPSKTIGHITGFINGASDTYSVSLNGRTTVFSSLCASDQYIDRVRVNADGGNASTFEVLEYDNLNVGNR